MRSRHFASLTGLLLSATALLVYQCSSGSHCDQNAGTFCQDGVTYWIDSCGNIGLEKEHCVCACSSDHSACTSCQCTTVCGGKCCGDNNCGGSCPDECSKSGQSCDAQSCTCQGQCQARDCLALGRHCGDWNDGCGKTIPCGDCGAGEKCDTTGQCQKICAGVQLTAGGVLDLDLKAVHVTGRVTLNGADLPDESDQRGELVFGDAVTGESFPVTLKSSGTLNYDVMLAPGSYNVRFAGNAALCLGSKPPKMPCNQGQLRVGISLTADGVLDVDIPAVQVQGKVTQKGAQLPNANSDRGSLVFALGSDGDLATKSFGNSGAASYQVTLLPGTYDLDWAGNAALCVGSSPAPVPCNSGPLRSAVALTASGVLDVDLPAVQIQGNVTLKGAAMPNASSDRGSLSFTLANGGTAIPKSFGSSGAVAYAITLLPGTYTVGYSGNASLCAGSTLPAVPCNSGPLKTSLSLTADGVLDLDIPVVKIQGNITLKGSPMPSANADRGNVVFHLKDGGELSPKSLGSSGAAGYALMLLPGSYGVDWAGNATLCQGSTAPAIPCNGGPLKSALSLTTDGILDLDVPAVKIQGNVTINGAAMPAASGDRGGLAFQLEQGSQASPKTFGSSGAASYALTLFPGIYTIGWVANQTLCQGSTVPPVPCNAGPLKAGVALTVDGVLDLDVPVVEIQGNVTLGGTPLPSEAGDRGGLKFTLVEGGSANPRGFGQSGPESYAIMLLPGTYLVGYQSNPSLCTPGASMPHLPCSSEILAGCVHP